MPRSCWAGCSFRALALVGVERFRTGKILGGSGTVVAASGFVGLVTRNPWGRLCFLYREFSVRGARSPQTCSGARLGACLGAWAPLGFRFARPVARFIGRFASSRSAGSSVPVRGSVAPHQIDGCAGGLWGRAPAVCLGHDAHTCLEPCRLVRARACVQSEASGRQISIGGSRWCCGRPCAEDGALRSSRL